MADYTRSQDEAVAVVDTVENAAVYERSEDEAIAVVDTLEDIQEHLRSEDEAVAVVDTVEAAATYERAEDESVAVVDTLDAAATYERSEDEAVAVVDTLEDIQGHLRSEDESVAVVDTLEDIQGHLRSEDEAVAVVDTQATATTYERSEDEIPAVVDTLHISAAFGRSQSESVRTQTFVYGTGRNGNYPFVWKYNPDTGTFGTVHTSPWTSGGDPYINLHVRDPQTIVATQADGGYCRFAHSQNGVWIDETAGPYGYALYAALIDDTGLFWLNSYGTDGGSKDTWTWNKGTDTWTKIGASTTGAGCNVLVNKTPGDYSDIWVSNGGAVWRGNSGGFTLIGTVLDGSPTSVAIRNPDGNVYVLGTRTYQLKLRQYVSGTTWTQIGPTIYGDAYTGIGPVLALASNNILIGHEGLDGSDRYCVLKRYNGSTWSEVVRGAYHPAGGNVTSAWSDLKYDEGAGRIYWRTGWYSSGNDRLYFSDDNGDTWDYDTIPGGYGGQVEVVTEQVTAATAEDSGYRSVYSLRSVDEAPSVSDALDLGQGYLYTRREDEAVEGADTGYRSVASERSEDETPEVVDTSFRSVASQRFESEQPQTRKKIYVTGRNDSNQPVLYTYDPDAGTFTLVHTHSSASTTESWGYTGIHVRDHENILLTASGHELNDTRFSWMINGSAWTDKVYSNGDQYECFSGVMRSNGTFWIATQGGASAPDKQGVRVYNPFTEGWGEVLRTQSDNQYSQVATNNGDDNEVWATSWFRNCYTWTGSSWVGPRNSPYPQAYTMPFCMQSPDGNVWVANAESGSFRAFKWTGSWTQVGTTYTPGHTITYAKKALAVSDSLIFAYYSYDPLDPKNVLIRWNGSSWSERLSITAEVGTIDKPGELFYDTEAGRIYCWMTLSETTENARLYFSDDDGDTWDYDTAPMNFIGTGTVAIISDPSAEARDYPFRSVASVRSSDDSVGVSDSLAISWGVDRHSHETIEVVDTVEKAATYERSEDDYTYAADAAQSEAVYSRSTSDTVVPEDAADLSRDVFRSEAEAVAVVDTVEKVAVYVRTRDDAVGVVDALSRVAPGARSRNEAVEVVDTVLKEHAASRARDESVGVEESTSKVATYERSRDESVEVVDTPSLYPGPSYRIVETVEAVDSLWRSVQSQRSRDEAVGVVVTESINERTFFTKAKAESVVAEDSVFKEVTYHRLQDDTAHGTDTEYRSTVSHRLAHEEVEAVDTYAMASYVARSADEAVVAEDAAFRSVASQRARDEVVGAEDAHLIERDFFFSRDETPEAVDTTAHLQAHDRREWEFLPVVDNVVVALDFSRLNDEVLSVVDAVAVTRALQRLSAEDAEAIDTLQINRSFLPARDETVTVADLLQRNLDYRRAHVDTLQVEDIGQINMAYSRSRGDVVTPVDALTLARQFFYRRDEAVGVLDTLLRAHHAQRSEAEVTLARDQGKVFRGYLRTESGIVTPFDDLVLLQLDFEGRRRDETVSTSDALGVSILHLRALQGSAYTEANSGQVTTTFGYANGEGWGSVPEDDQVQVELLNTAGGVIASHLVDSRTLRQDNSWQVVFNARVVGALSVRVSLIGEATVVGTATFPVVSLPRRFP